ncbi:MAG TPA: permease prefix domain 1-containing protein, partial [Vicinamibacterales bacterium]|nr:permease prefix domain 1-containing protein [Vicinamibacterales bacterium]
MRVLFRRLRYVLLGRDDDLREEMEVHRAMRQAQLEQDGMSPAEAAAASCRAMGNVALAREDARAIWLWPWLDSVRQDARYALRAIARQPGFSVIAVGTLGLAIGLNTAVFDIYSALTLRPWRAADPQRLVTIYSLSDRDLRARAGG